MDTKCVRVMRPYEDNALQGMVMLVDEAARVSLGVPWNSDVLAVGRFQVVVKIEQLKDFDQDGNVSRVGQETLDKLFVSYGEEVLLYALNS